MSLIAMTLEMGSLGDEVAQGVARELGRAVVHHEIIGHLADKMRVRKSHVIRFLDNKATVLDGSPLTGSACRSTRQTRSIALRSGTTAW